MILNVKLLSGGAGSAASSCDVVAREGDSVESLKRQIEEKLRLGSGTEQKLLFKGKTLQGEHVKLRKLQRELGVQGLRMKACRFCLSGTTLKPLFQ